MLQRVIRFGHKVNKILNLVYLLFHKRRLFVESFMQIGSKAVGIERIVIQSHSINSQLKRLDCYRQLRQLYGDLHLNILFGSADLLTAPVG